MAHSILRLGMIVKGLFKEPVDSSDGEFDPTNKGKRKKTRAKASSISAVEQPRLDAHTLKENHDFMFSSSFAGPDNAMGGLISSSSQFGGFGFDDNLDLGGDIGDELARELGEGWGAPATPAQGPPVQANDGDIMMGNLDDQEFAPNPLDEFGGVNAMDPAPIPQNRFDTGMENSLFNEGTQSLLNLIIITYHVLIGEALFPEGSIILPLSPLGQSPGSRAQDAAGPVTGKQPKKGKRVRLLLDARTELTNEELERARANYMEGQALIRRELEQKKSEKDHGKLIDEMLWGAPRGINAPALVDFWHESFRLQVEARAGELYIDVHGEPPRKRRRVKESGEWEVDDEYQAPQKETGIAGEPDFDMGFGNGMDDQFNMYGGALGE
ncbi:hypothetical protein EIP86_002904 [Pleurotus ostreatoroseus]|nr:hypothetical protein EIP86_002904 [Pleurotus ostreatoroseus]